MKPAIHAINNASALARNAANGLPTCGFINVRKDESGYYCMICGQRMDDAWEARVLNSPSLYRRLKAQCGQERTQ